LTERADDGARIERAYLLLFGRPATATEQERAKDFLAQVKVRLNDEAKAWQSLARAWFMSNEFVYVE
jgi:hypothetical protein